MGNKIPSLLKDINKLDDYDFKIKILKLNEIVNNRLKEILKEIHMLDFKLLKSKHHVELCAEYISLNNFKDYILHDYCKINFPFKMDLYLKYIEVKSDDKEYKKGLKKLVKTVSVN